MAGERPDQIPPLPGAHAQRGDPPRRVPVERRHDRPLHRGQPPRDDRPRIVVAVVPRVPVPPRHAEKARRAAVP